MPVAVVYARYSSDLQREASIEDQIRICRERIEREGWEYFCAYTDRAQSGASALRPAYQKLLEDARRGQFEVVVAEALDRLSRDQEDVAGLLKRLRFAGVRLFTLAEGEKRSRSADVKSAVSPSCTRQTIQVFSRAKIGGPLRPAQMAPACCAELDQLKIGRDRSIRPECPGRDSSGSFPSARSRPARRSSSPCPAGCPA